MVAGEASGDLLGAHLIAALKARRPGLAFSGIGGPKMIAQGFDSRLPMEKLAVRGYAEVLRHYREITSIRRRLAERLIAERPAAFIGVDSSDFNLHLEKQLKDAGIPAIHYVSPAIWAWRGWRVRRIAQSVTHLLAMFPFEPALYEKAGVPVTYVGHPLADVIPLQVDKGLARAELRLPASSRVIALLPGSRRSELHYMADLFVLTARRLMQDLPQAHFVCPTVSRATRELFEAALRRHGARDLPLTLLFGHSHEALAAAEIALVASGTATLEAALFKTPLVITYRQAALTWAIQKRMAYLPYIGMPNILAGERLVPEFVQDKATPGALAEALLALLHDGEAKRRQIEKFHEIHAILRQGTAQKAADAVLGVLDAASA
ncbi:MAG TPA: lipid-A-disaccharide synthase [Burkholderiales bacterium]|jgi:lipid-A-disaccharide synthase|nr:lipid-A-disaccharide synthase [Burkholderiales bacterium]